MKRQKFKEGSVVKIGLANQQIVFGRLLPGFHLGILNYFLILGEKYDIDDILQSDTLLYVRVFKDVVEKNFFEIVGFKDLTTEDINRIPPHFAQDPIDIDKCKIYYLDGKELDVTPNECQKLEGSIIWDAESLASRIKNYLEGKKNPYVELYKVILSKDDPRYLAPPNALRWDFEKGEFYRIDK